MNIFKLGLSKNKKLLNSFANIRTYTGVPVQSSEGFIDFRSDTVTRPNQKMREAMSKCAVGDDVYNDDPTVNLLQKEMASLFGKEDALFVASGTMGNLISMMVNVKHKGDGALIGHLAHVYCIERGGMSAIGSVHPITVQNKADATFDLQELEDNIPPKNIHLPQAKVICLENTHNNCNGRVLRMDYVQKVKKIADKYSLKMHLDGARCLNAAVFLNVTPAELVKDFDTISFCLSKGMGCPIGSVVLGSHEDIQHARIIRKMLGGQMRQVGILASCGLISLEDWKEQLSTDHENAKYLAHEFSKISALSIDPSSQETNIFRFKLQPDFKKYDHAGFCNQLREKNRILMNPSFKNDAIRIVTHRDVNRKQIDEAIKAFKQYL